MTWDGMSSILLTRTGRGDPDVEGKNTNDGKNGVGASFFSTGGDVSVSIFSPMNPENGSWKGIRPKPETQPPFYELT